MSVPKAHSLRFEKAYRMIGWLIVFAIVLLSLINPPNLELNIDHGDKYGHVAAYCVAMFWQLMLHPTRRARWIWALGLIILGLALEWAQGNWTTSRAMDWRDGLADALGVVLALLLAKTRLVHALNWIDRFAQSRRWR